MAKFYGKIGYGVTEEVRPGVWEEVVIERPYYGDVNRNRRRWASSERLNDNLDVTNEISIVADPYAYKHFHTIRYVEWMDARWKISDVEVEYPRLKLVIGGVYNGPGPKTDISSDVDAGSGD